MLKFTPLKILGLIIIVIALTVCLDIPELYPFVLVLGLCIILLDLIVNILIRNETTNKVVQTVLLVIIVAVLSLIFIFVYYLAANW